MQASDQRQLLNAYFSLASQESCKGIENYLNYLVINSAPDPAPFAEVAYPFQWDRASKIGPAIEAIAGLRPNYTGPRGFFEVAARGFDKTTGLGRLLNWAVAFSPKPLKIVAAASDRDQAHLLAEAMQTEAKLNPWLEERINFTTRAITGPGGVLKIQSADAGSAYGLTPDIMILDEIVWWPKRDLFDALMSGRQKRPGAVTLIITNAGVIPSWQHDNYELFKDMNDWEVYSYSSRVKTWMSQEQKDVERKLLPEGLAKRVFDNVWLDAAEESGYLTKAHRDDAQELGTRMGLTYKQCGEPGKRYYVGVDYGARKDRTCVTVVHNEKTAAGPILVVDRMDVFCGSKSNPVSLDRLEELLREINLSFSRPTFVVDPYQLEQIIQRLGTFMRIERFDARAGNRNYEMAELLRSLFANNRLAFYQGCGIISTGEDWYKELSQLIVKPTGATYRFDHTKQQHDDRTVAVGMAALQLFSEYDHGPGLAPATIKPKVAAVLGSEAKRLGVDKLVRKDSNLKVFGM